MRAFPCIKLQKENRNVIENRSTWSDMCNDNTQAVFYVNEIYVKGTFAKFDCAFLISKLRCIKGNFLMEMGRCRLLLSMQIEIACLEMSRDIKKSQNINAGKVSICTMENSPLIRSNDDCKVN